MSAERPEHRQFHDFLARHRTFLLTTHINPDGDGLGSEAALSLWLSAQGRRVRILNDSVVPPQFAFLARHTVFEVFDPGVAEQRLVEADALIVLDTSNRQRIGRLAPLLDRTTIPVAVVDHHVSHARGFGHVNVIEPEASATGEILFELFRQVPGTVTEEIAEALYIALMTDTGSFRYSNTDTHAHRMAAELLGYGLDPQRLWSQVHAQASAGRLRFFGEVLSALELDVDGRLVVLDARPEQFQRHGLVGADTDGFFSEVGIATVRKGSIIVGQTAVISIIDDDAVTIDEIDVRVPRKIFRGVTQRPRGEPVIRIQPRHQIVRREIGGHVSEATLNRIGLAVILDRFPVAELRRVARDDFGAAILRAAVLHDV